MHRIALWFCAGLLGSCASFQPKGPAGSMASSREAAATPAMESVPPASFAAASADSPPASAESARVQAAAGPAALAGPPPPLDGRKIAYSADYTILVPDLDKARRSLVETAIRLGGHVVEESETRVVFAAPPERFREAEGSVESLGEVASRRVLAEDVTAGHIELSLRIEVAEASRKRLMEHLAGAAKTEDVLSIERDIRRLTEEIEGYGAALRVLNERVAMARITVKLELHKPAPPPPPPPPPPARSAAPLFGWMADLGPDRLLSFSAGGAAWLKGAKAYGLIPVRPFRLGGPGSLGEPEGFTPVLWDGRTLLAASAKDDRFRAFRVETGQEADLDFWAAALAHDAARVRGYALPKGAEPFAVESKNLEARVIRCRVPREGGEGWAYDLYVVARKNYPRHLVIVEHCHDPREAPPEQSAAADEAVRGMRFGPKFMW